MADTSLFGAGPRGHHLSNVVLHAATMALLSLLLWRMTGSPHRSMLAAGVVAVHPLRVESVAWIAERKDLLSAFFALLAFGAYLGWVRRRRPASYLACLALLLAGLAAKPVLVTVPVLFGVLDYWPLGRIGGPMGLGLAHAARARRRKAAVPRARPRRLGFHRARPEPGRQSPPWVG